MIKYSIRSMLLNFIKAEFKEDLLVQKYLELISSNVKPSEILVLVQNSNLKRKFEENGEVGGRRYFPEYELSFDAAD